MKAKYGILYKGSEWEIVKQVGKTLPHVGTPVLAQALVVKSINLGNLPRLVVPSKNKNPIRPADLETH